MASKTSAQFAIFLLFHICLPLIPQSSAAESLGPSQGAWWEVEKLAPTSIELGAAVSSSGRTFVAGAPNTYQEGPGTGEVRVFQMLPDGSIRQHRLRSSDSHARQKFGSSVFVSESDLVVGAPGTVLYTEDGPEKTPGAVYLFERQASGFFTETMKVPEPSEAARFFGGAVLLQGDTLLVSDYVGTDGAGEVYVFERQGDGSFLHTQLLRSGINDDTSFGHSLAMFGDTLAIGAPYDGAGSIFVFERQSDGLFVQVDILREPRPNQNDELWLWPKGLGWSVALDGDVLVVGAKTTGLDFNPNGLEGAVYVYSRDEDGNFQRRTVLVAPQPQHKDDFGSSVDIAGGSVVVGAGYYSDEDGIRKGAVFVFDPAEGGTFEAVATLRASDGASADWFGNALAASNGMVFVGAYGDDCNNLNHCGATYLFSDLPDVQVEIDDVLDPSPEGAPLVHVLTVSNKGSNPADQVLLTVQIPAGLTLVGSSAGCSLSGQVLTCGPDNFAPSSSKEYQITSEVEPSAPDRVSLIAEVIAGTGDLIPSDNIDLETTTLHPGVPVILEARTGSGMPLGLCTPFSTIEQEITLLFSEPLFDSPGDEIAADVTNVSNYLLLSPGEGGFETQSCEAGVAATDIASEILGVSYDPGTREATLALASARQGQFLLRICGDLNGLQDESGVKLDGDGDGIEGGDALLPFRIEASTGLSNGHFDCDLRSWLVSDSDGSLMFSENDRLEPNPSGSVRAETNLGPVSSELAIRQCVPTVNSTTCRLGSHLSLSEDSVAEFTREVAFYETTDCSGIELEVVLLGSESVAGDSESWTRFSDTCQVPSEAKSGMISLSLASVNGNFTGSLDDIAFSQPTLIFQDSFETGDLRRWSASR